MAQDNGSLIESIDEKKSSKTRLCHLIKRTDFDGYGFNLHSEKSKPGQYVGKVDPNSPAEDAGLTEGDRIIEVNGVSIGNETHKEVVQRIKAISCEVRLLIIAANSANEFQLSENEHKNQTNSEISVNSIESNPNSVTNSRTTASSPNEKSPQNKAISANDINYPPPPSSQTVSAASVSVNSSQAGLKLPETAAEMRAKLLSKKKYDPKNENVDLKRKFEIVQKL